MCQKAQGVQGATGMARLAAWEFGDRAVFDGEKLYAEVMPESDRTIRSGTLEITLTPDRLNRAAIFSHGVPGRDPGAFTLVLTHTGAVSLSCTERSGAAFRAKTPDGFVGIGETLQITLSVGLGGRFVVVNCTRREAAPADPAAGFVQPLPLRARCDLRGTHKFTFGAAAGGMAPFFRGKIHLATLTDTVDEPTVAPPVAQIHHVDFRTRRPIAPRRVERIGDPVTPRPEFRFPRKGASAIRVATADGDLPLSHLTPGQEVLTRANGLRPVRWIGRAELSWPELRKRPDLQPILLRRGALGPDLPEADMILSPAHRLLVPGAALRETGPAADGFLPAGDLPVEAGAVEIEALGTVFTHFHFEGTETVQINGLWVEALNPFDKSLNPAQIARRDEIFRLFPELSDRTDSAAH